jgi:hypothetical protein
MGLLKMKNLAYLQAYGLKSIREARRILNHGITVEEIDEYLKSPLGEQGKPASYIKTEPCKTCGKKLSRGIIGLAKAEFGLDRASDETVAERKKICLACPWNDLGRCSQCNCYLHAKIRIKKEACPEHKWREDNGFTEHLLAV